MKPDNWEHSYLDLCMRAINSGYEGNSRVGLVHALPGEMLKINLPHGEFPLLTTRKMFPKPVLGELTGFLHGATMNGFFMKHGCNYWTPNARGKHPNLAKWKDEDLPLGPIYGYQWRKFNGDSRYDQLAQAKRDIINNPTSRRIVVTAWNPLQNDYACLPPCHIMFQYHVLGGRLHCTVYMRSVDLCLGLPSDVVLYYALLVLMAADTGLPVGSLTFHFGNAHVYREHLDGFLDQYHRPVMATPTYTLGKTGAHGMPITSYIDQFIPEVLAFNDYNPHERIHYALLA